MSIGNKIGKGALYGTLGAIVADTATRAVTGEGFVEKLPYGTNVLEYLGLIQQKVATDLAQFTQHLDQIGRKHFEDLLKAVGTGDASINAFESRAREFVDYINAQTTQLKEISRGAGYVADKTKNTIIASVALLSGIVNARYDLLRRIKGSRVKFGRAFQDGIPEVAEKPLEQRIDELKGVYVTTKLATDYRFFKGSTYDKNSTDSMLKNVKGPLRSFENSSRQREVTVAPGESAYICYLVPGGSNYKVEGHGFGPITETVKGNSKESFFIGLKEVELTKPGDYEIKLTIGDRVYTSKVTVKPIK